MLMRVRSWMPSSLVDCGAVFAVLSAFSDSVQLDVSPSGLQVAWCFRFLGAPVSDTGAGGASTTRESDSGLVWHIAQLIRRLLWISTTTTTGVYPKRAHSFFVSPFTMDLSWQPVTGVAQRRRGR